MLFNRNCFSLYLCLPNWLQPDGYAVNLKLYYEVHVCTCFVLYILCTYTVSENKLTFVHSHSNSDFCFVFILNIHVAIEYTCC